MYKRQVEVVVNPDSCHDEQDTNGILVPDELDQCSSATHRMQ